MISVTPIRSVSQTGARYIIAFCTQDEVASCASHLASYVTDIDKIAADKKFTGKAGSLCTITGMHDGKVVTVCLVGLGKKEAGSISIETYRRGIGKAIKSLQSSHHSAGAIVIPDAQLFARDIEYVVEQTVMIAQMSAYRFDTYITDADRKVEQNISIDIVVDHDSGVVQSAIKKGLIVATAVNKTRLWIDTPPSHLTPPILADHAQMIARKHNLSITVYGEEEVKKMGMGGLAGVSAGSDQDCRFVTMEYKVSDDAPTVCFVGKGITFDSGGLSLKPPRYMETMKEDMSGAATVISTMEAIAQLKPDINIIGITALAENLPSGKATKPGDIITFYNGKTAEVKNTDAEGRLVLADALSYAVKHYKPDAIIDLATLTGACAYALGPFFTGMMSQHDELVSRMDAASAVSGDRLWRLPLDNDYQKVIQSPVADICNIGNEKYMAGAITAAFFLKAFVDDVPWVHLDIAGTAFGVPDISYYTQDGATGVGVRLLVELAMKWK